MNFVLMRSVRSGKLKTYEFKTEKETLFFVANIDKSRFRVSVLFGLLEE